MIGKLSIVSFKYKRCMFMNLNINMYGHNIYSLKCNTPEKKKCS